jgi:hypothetical protein
MESELLDSLQSRIYEQQVRRMSDLLMCTSELLSIPPRSLEATRMIILMHYSCIFLDCRCASH